MVLPGDPISKARPRSGSNFNTYTPKRTKDAEKRIAAAARELLGEEFVPVDVPVGIAVELFCATRRRSDGDNMLKTITDALNKVVYVDDYLIEEFFCRVYRGVGEPAARMEVMVWQLGDAVAAQPEPVPAGEGSVGAAASEGASVADDLGPAVVVELQTPVHPDQPLASVHRM